MASKYVVDLKVLAYQLRKDGMVHSSGICAEAAVRMESMEKYITNQENNTEDDWYEELEKI